MSDTNCSYLETVNVKIYDTFLEFKPITLESKSLIESYTKPWETECSDFSFTNMFIWGTNGKIEYAEKNDFLFIKLDFKGVPIFFWSPIPKKEFCHDITLKDYSKALSIAISYMEDANVEPTFRSVCKPFHSIIQKACPDFFSMPTEIAWDYVYEKEKLKTLSGKKLHKKRNHINKFLSLYPNYTYKNLEPHLIQDCLQLYDLWIQEKNNDASLLAEQQSVLLALNNLQELGLSGGCIYLEDRLVAFTIGERLTNDMHLIHIEKADHTIEGIFPMINQQYIKYACDGVAWINREEDMGLEGMRKAKRSYYPARMIEKYMVGIRDLSEVSGLWGEK